MYKNFNLIHLKSTNKIFVEIYFNSIIGAQVIFFLDFLFEKIIGLGLLDAWACGFVAAVVSGRISLEQLRAQLIVHADQYHRTAERSHFRILGIHLIDVGNSLAQHFNGNIVVVFILEALGFVDGTLNLRAAVSFEFKILLMTRLN